MIMFAKCLVFVCCLNYQNGGSSSGIEKSKFWFIRKVFLAWCVPLQIKMVQMGSPTSWIKVFAKIRRKTTDALW